jgi:hypothetical protein
MGRNRTPRVCLVLALLTAGRLVAPDKDPKDDPPKPTKGILSYKPLKADPKDDELRKLQIERYNAALEELQALSQKVVNGSKSPGSYFDAGKRVVESGLEIYDKPQDRITLLTDYVELAKDTEKVFKAQLEAGRMAADVYHQARYYRLDAEMQLLKAKRAAEKSKDK